MKILAIETSSNLCSVSVLEDDKLIKEIISDEEKNHSIMLMPLIDELLTSLNLKLDDIDLFACDKGPGSFTGIRIGISTIKGFCDVLNKPCIGISSLDSLARCVKENGYICSLIDAKHNNVYCGIYKFENGKYVQIHDYLFDNINNILNLLNDELIFNKCLKSAQSRRGRTFSFYKFSKEKCYPCVGLFTAILIKL